MATSYLTTSTRKGWEGPGETTIRRTFKQPIGGAIQKKAQTDQAIDDSSEYRHHRLHSAVDYSRGILC